MSESIPSSETAFPRALVDRIVGRRGRVHPTTAIAPRRTALVVLDMQRAFTEAEQPVGTASAKAVVPAINRLAQALRAAGGHVAFSQATFNADADGGWPAYFGRMVGPATAARIVAAVAGPTMRPK